MKKILLSLTLSLTLLGWSSSPSHAAGVDENDVKSSSHFEVFDVFNNSGEDGDLDPLPEEILANAEKENVSPVGALILRVINVFSLLIGTLSFFVILYGGFMFMTSAGNDSQVDKARSVLSQALYGLTLGFMSYFIVTFVLSFFYE